MNSSYETLYGVGLLDDLHNYFPALLYDSSGFSNVQDVLTYIQQQTRNRFDLFSLGRRNYRPAAPVVSAAAHEAVAAEPAPVTRSSVSHSPLFSRGIHQYFGRPASNLQGSTLLQPHVRNGILTYTANIPLNTDMEHDDEGEGDESTQQSIQAAEALLSLFLPERQTRIITPGRSNLFDSFLQPVVVRPTPEQITRFTSVGNRVSDTELACAICQDQLLADQEGRRLNACGHWFHRNCIDTWFQSNVHCPVCRHDIRVPSVPTRSRSTSIVTGGEPPSTSS